MGTRRVCRLTGVAISLGLFFLSTVSGYFGEKNESKLSAAVRRSETIRLTSERFKMAVEAGNRAVLLIHENLRRKESFWRMTPLRLLVQRVDILGANREELWKLLSDEDTTLSTEDKSFDNFQALGPILDKQEGIERDTLHGMLHYRVTAHPTVLTLDVQNRCRLLLLMRDIVTDVAKEYNTLLDTLKAVVLSPANHLTHGKIAQIWTQIAVYLKQQGDKYQAHLNQWVRTVHL